VPAPSIAPGRFSTLRIMSLCNQFTVEKGKQYGVINPLLTKKYERSSIRGSKTDRIDAKRLAEIGLLESDLPDFFDSRQSLPAKQYQSILNKLEKTKQELTTSLNQTVKIAELVGVTLELDCVQKAVEDISQAINILKKMITGLASPLAKELSKIPGISLFQATSLCLATQNRVFPTRDQLIAFFGLDVKQRQSGNWRGNQKLSKRGNPYLRKILFQLGWSLSMNNTQYKEYYNHQYREKDQHYYTAIIATSRKFLRYYFAMLKASRVDNGAGVMKEVSV
jgi:transposase